MTDARSLTDADVRELFAYDAVEDDLAWELTRSALEQRPDPGPPVLPVDLDTWAPDLRLAAVLSVVDLDRLSGADRVTVLKAQERMNAAGAAASLRALTAIADVYDELDVDDPDGGAGLEVRSALRWTRRAAESELALAHDLRVRLPRLFESLSAGLVDRRRAAVFARHTDHLPAAHARMVVDALIDDARRLTTGQLIEQIRRLCIDIDPDAARRRYESSRADRRVVSWSEPDGTVTLAGIGLNPVDVASARDLIDRLARRRRTDDPSKTVDEHRADVYSDLVNGRLTAAHRTGDGITDRAGTVHLVVDLSTLAGMNDDSAELAGYGPIGADIARQLVDTLGRGVWDWTVIHPGTGTPIADGTTRRRPTASQIRKMRAMNRTCVAPGCRMPVVDCDIDHTRPWAETGITDSAQLAALCRHDHCIRHHTGWTYHRLDDGDHRWTSPLGTSYTTSGADPP